MSDIEDNVNAQIYSIHNEIHNNLLLGNLK